MKELTFALIKPDAVAAGYEDAIRSRILAEGFEILREERRQLSPQMAEEFYREHSHEAWYAEIVRFMSSGPLIALALAREDAVRAWRALIGHRWPPVARQLAPTCLRALYGTEGLGANAVHGADSVEAARRELRLFGWHDLCH